MSGPGGFSEDLEHTWGCEEDRGGVLAARGTLGSPVFKLPYLGGTTGFLCKCYCSPSVSFALRVSREQDSWLLQEQFSSIFWSHLPGRGFSGRQSRAWSAQPCEVAWPVGAWTFFFFFCFVTVAICFSWGFQCFLEILSEALGCGSQGILTWEQLEEEEWHCAGRRRKDWKRAIKGNTDARKTIQMVKKRI